MSSSPLQSTFALPSHVYGRMPELPLVDWSLTDNDDDSSKTKTMLLEELNELQLNLHAAKACKIGAVRAIDATNAQMALSGMALM